MSSITETNIEKIIDYVRTESLDFSFGEILNLHDDNEIVIQPEYQRLFRWSVAQRSKLIESILLELPIPQIFLVESDNGILELIDGLQRISSVLQFLNSSLINLHPLVLDGCDIITDINGLKFDDLPIYYRLKIKRSPIRATIIKKQSHSFVKYQMFMRLNTGGSLLSPQEVRNCSSRMVEGGERFYAFIQNLAAQDYFRQTIDRLSDADKEQRGDEELVLRFFAISDYLDGYHGNVKEWLDNYMEDILIKKRHFDYQQQSARFEQVFKFVAEVWNADAFARYKNGEAQGRLPPAYFEAVCGGLLANLDRLDLINHEKARTRLIEVVQSSDFKAVIGPGANNITKLNSRINMFKSAFNRLAS